MSLDLKPAPAPQAEGRTGHSRRHGRSSARLVVLGCLILALMVTLLARLADLQLVNGSGYADAATGNRVREHAIDAPRGLILDRTGRVLVGNRAAVDLAIDPKVLARQDDDGAQVLGELARLVGYTGEELLLRAKPCGTEGAAKPPRCWNGNPAEPATVVRDVDPAIATALMERRDSLPGVSTVISTVRSYPAVAGANAAHLLGYLSGATQDEVAAGLNPSDQVGRGGLEEQYDSDLRGARGTEDVTVDRRGVAIGSSTSQPPIPGRTLRTTIDARLQSVVEKQLAAALDRARQRDDRVTGRRYEADSGAAVVVDLRNGDVLAMASAPTFDPEAWVGGISSKEYADLTGDESGQPLLSRATQGLFAPASTFKAFTTAAALESGYSASGAYPCPSSYSVGGTRFSNYESKAYGYISLTDALEVSCDTVFYRLAHQLWKRDGGDDPKASPRDAITRTAEAFGLGTKTGIDLPDEFAGRVGSREYKQGLWEDNHEAWCSRARSGYPEESKAQNDYLTAIARENCADGARWRAGDAINTSIGQGDTAITPLQLAMAYGAIGNGGTLWKPRLVSAVTDASGKVVRELPPTVRAEVPVSPGTLSYLRRALRSVTDHGTGGIAFNGFPLAQIPIASKTGTGEVAGKQATSWYASYAPADNPRYAVVMMVSQGGSGARTSGPSVRGIYEAIFGVKGMSVDPSRSVLGDGR